MYNRLMIPLLACALLPLSAAASESCKYSAARDLTLELAGAREVVFDIGAQDLQLTSSASGNGRLQGRACASSQDLLDSLSLSQRREGDQLMVKLERRQGLVNINLGSSEARLQVQGALPAALPVRVRVGSGDARITGAPALVASVGSGDLVASGIGGAVNLTVGSGDASLQRIGSLHLEGLGSGDVSARGINGGVRINNVGSGDVSLEQVGGNVDIGNIGSGEVELAGVGGNVSLSAMGSGDLRVRNVSGNLSVGAVGSGDVHHSGVGGQVQLPRKR